LARGPTRRNQSNWLQTDPGHIDHAGKLLLLVIDTTSKAYTHVRRSEACATRLCSHAFSVGLNPETSMALTKAVVGAFSAPAVSAKESSHFQCAWKSLSKCRFAWSFPSPCFGQLRLHVAVMLA